MIFETVAKMKLAKLTAGQLINTKGYSVAGDGGGASYLVAASQTVDGYGDHALAGGTVALLQVEGTANVRQFGAKGDGNQDDQPALQAAIDSFDTGGGVAYFPAGDYFITNTLPMTSNVTLRGAGMPSYKTYWLDINRAYNTSEGAVIEVSDLNSPLSHRLMSGDVVKINGSFDSGMEGVKEILQVDPANNRLIISGTITYVSAGTSTGVTDPLNNIAGSLRVSVLSGGSIVRFQNCTTGDIITGERFFDCEDARNVSFYDLGFVGPGINAVYGGGMRFRRIREPDGRSRAISGYHWNNVFLTHSAQEGIRFDQLIHSYLGHLNINRCVDDALIFKAGPEGGTTTSVHIDTPYIQNCRRGIAFYTAAYCTLTNPVVEGTSLGYYVNRGIGLTLNGMASETIKYDSAGQSGGVTGLFINSYGLAINAATVYYNTEESAWSKAAMVFIDPQKRTESPTAVINGGHIHWSLGEKIPIIATRWGSDKIGRIYLDVSEDSGYIPPDGSIGSSWIGNSFWDNSIQIKMVGVDRDSIFNDRYKVDEIQKTLWVDSGKTETNRPPNSTDDSTAGYTAFNSFWQNTEEEARSGRYVCIDATTGAAVWVKTEETYEVDFVGRDENPLSKLIETGDAYAIRLGRNYGVDIATDAIQRILGTETASNGDLIAYLDVAHLHPDRYPVKINYDPYFLNSTKECVVKRIEKVTEGGTDYILVELIVPDDNWNPSGGDPSPHTDIIEDALNANGDPIELRYEDNGPATVINPVKRKLDAASENLFLYFDENSYIDVADTFSMYNAMLSEMDGRWTVDTKEIDLKEGVACIKVRCSDRSLRSSIEYSVDYAVYVLDKWSAPVSNSITVDGLDTLYTFDEANAVSVQTSRQGKGIALSSSSSTLVEIPAANNYEYYAYFRGSLQRISYLTSDYKTVTFQHDTDSSDQVFHWIATRKKSPGVEAIYDRN